ncbi:MAG: GxxExxY protein [Burkholderiales bacterium]|nr:GxxExxY protein [Phycisphaerae bacterium]
MKVIDPAYVGEDEEPDPKLNELTNRIIGVLIEVHKALGPGYLESYYERAVEIEFIARGLRYSRQHSFGVMYKGEVIGEGRLDFLVEDTVILEMKHVESIGSAHVATMISYLKANKKPLGIIANFNVKLLKDGLRRIAN